MRILVTGASGFSGAFLVRFLAQAGHQVTGLFRRRNAFLACLGEEPNVALMQGDLTRAIAVPGRFDVLIHAAGTSPAPGVTEQAMLADNVEGMRGAIAAAAASECRKLIFLSSISLYGTITGPVLDETAPIVAPDIYGAAKLMSEQILAAEADRLPSLSLRLPGIVGPGAHRNWLSGVAARLLAGDPVPAFNLSGPYNNAVHIEDIARLIAGLLDRPWQGCDAVILAARGAITVRQVIERLAGALGVAAQIAAIPAPVSPFTLDPSRAIERWGYDPMEIGVLVDRYGAEMRTLAR